MSSFRLIFIISTLIVLTSLTGCKEKLQPGHYEGNLFRKDPSGPLIQPVHLEVSYPSKSEAKIKVRNSDLNTLSRISASVSRKGQVVLEMIGMHSGSYTLSRVPVDKNPIENYRCYADSNPQRAELCFSKSQFSFTVEDSTHQPLFSLTGSKFKKEAPFALESPEDISLHDAIDLAFTHNFDSKIAFERVFQAKNAATSAWLNLLPHLTSNLIWHAPLPTYVSAIAVLQGLTPFLLPTYWMEAKNADYQVKIQKDALLITQADIASTVEQLFYAYDRDLKIDRAHRQILASLDAFEDNWGRSETQASHGAQAELFQQVKERLIQVLQTTHSKLDRVLKEDRFAISLALGKHNPEAISNIVVEPEQIEISRAIPVNQVEIGDWASQRSFELAQISTLIQIAQMKEVELFFYWLDPSADQKTSLGFNLIGQERVAKSQINELKIKREQIKSTLYQNAFRIALDYNETLEAIQTTPAPTDLNSKLQELWVILASSMMEETPKSQEAETWIQTTLAEIVGYESNLASFRIARAKKDRILLAGYFQRLLPKLPSVGITMESQR